MMAANGTPSVRDVDRQRTASIASGAAVKGWTVTIAAKIAACACGRKTMLSVSVAGVTAIGMRAFRAASFANVILFQVEKM